MLSEKDLLFISKIINLSLDKTRILTEEESDLNLILSKIAEKNIPTKKLSNVSFGLKCKLFVFTAAISSSFSIEEKSYVAKCISEHYFSIKRRINLSLISDKNLTEKASGYYLVVSGLFYDKINVKYLQPKHLLWIEYGFKKANQRDLGIHTENWVNILRNMNKEAWFQEKEMVLV